MFLFILLSSFRNPIRNTLHITKKTDTRPLPAVTPISVQVPGGERLCLFVKSFLLVCVADETHAERVASVKVAFQEQIVFKETQAVCKLLAVI